MKNIPYKLPLLGILILVLGALAWWYFSPTPQEIFLKDVDAMIEKANQGKHLELRDKISPEAEQFIAENFLPVQQALLVTRKLDTEEHSRYRLVKLHVFNAGDYAEIEVERSGPEGNFSGALSFPVPFIYRNGTWLLAGAFRGDREFVSPYR